MLCVFPCAVYHLCYLFIRKHWYSQLSHKACVHQFTYSSIDIHSYWVGIEFIKVYFSGWILHSNNDICWQKPHPTQAEMHSRHTKLWNVFKSNILHTDIQSKCTEILTIHMPSMTVICTNTQKDEKHCSCSSHMAVQQSLAVYDVTYVCNNWDESKCDNIEFMLFSLSMDHLEIQSILISARARESMRQRSSMYELRMAGEYQSAGWKLQQIEHCAH